MIHYIEGFVGFLFVVYILWYLSKGWGINFGTLFLLAAGALMLLHGYIKVRKPDFTIWRGWTKKLKPVVNTILIAFLISFIVVEALIISYAQSNKQSNENPDVLLILGAGLMGDVLSLELKERLDLGLEYVKEHQGIPLIVSGAQGPGELVTESSAMKRYLISNGIPEEQVIEEDRATSTFENMKYSLEIIKEHFGKTDVTIAIITNDFHLFRSRMIAGRFGLKSLPVAAPTPIYVVPVNYAREYFAVIKSLIVDWPVKE